MKSTDQHQYFLKVEEIDRVRYNKMYTAPLLSIIAKELNLNIIKPDYRRNRIRKMLYNTMRKQTTKSMETGPTFCLNCNSFSYVLKEQGL